MILLLCSGWGIYTEVKKSFAELSFFEDIIQSGSVLDGDVGIWVSEAMDTWGASFRTRPSYNSLQEFFRHLHS